MEKKNVITLMTDHMMDLNMQAAKMAGMKENEYKKQLEAMYPQIYMVNGKVLDLLIENDLIKNVN